MGEHQKRRSFLAALVALLEFGGAGVSIAHPEWKMVGFILIACGFVPLAFWVADVLREHARRKMLIPTVMVIAGAILMAGGSFWIWRKYADTPAPAQVTVHAPAPRPSGFARLAISRIDLVNQADGGVSFLVNFQNKGSLAAVAPAFRLRATKVDKKLSDAEVDRALAELREEAVDLTSSERRASDVEVGDEGDIGAGPTVPGKDWPEVADGKKLIYLFVVFLYRDEGLTDDTSRVRSFATIYSAPLQTHDIIVNRDTKWVLGQDAAMPVVASGPNPASTAPGARPERVEPQASPKPVVRDGAASGEMRARFTSTQTVSTFPSETGENRTLNLDNVATLRLGVPYSANDVTMVLDPVVVRLDGEHDPGIQVEALGYRAGRRLLFDQGENKRQFIDAGGRVFVVTLTEIDPRPVAGEARPFKFTFSISER